MKLKMRSCIGTTRHPENLAEPSALYTCFIAKFDILLIELPIFLATPAKSKADHYRQIDASDFTTCTEGWLCSRSARSRLSLLAIFHVYWRRARLRLHNSRECVLPHVREKSHNAPKVAGGPHNSIYKSRYVYQKHLLDIERRTAWPG